jgi:hypothetical protein
MELAACARAEEKEATKQPLALVGQLVDLGAMLVPCLGLMGSQTMAGMVVPIHALRGQTGVWAMALGADAAMQMLFTIRMGAGAEEAYGEEEVVDAMMRLVWSPVALVVAGRPLFLPRMSLHSGSLRLLISATVLWYRRHALTVLWEASAPPLGI